MIEFVVGTPVGLAVAVAAIALLVWTSVDLWRNTGYAQARKIGWQLVIGGLSVGPLVRLEGGWMIAFPAGTLLYLLLATRGPLRRRSRPAAPAAGSAGAATE